MIMNDGLQMPLAAAFWIFEWWQVGGIFVVIGMIIGLKIYRSKQM